jgi:putative DNA primase/helicase
MSESTELVAPARRKSVALRAEDNPLLRFNELCRKTMVHFNDKKKPIGEPENIRILLDLLEVIIRYNVMTKETEVSIPDVMFTVDNRYNASLAWIMGKMKQIEMSTGHAVQFLDMLADWNTYNPVMNWIESKPWDGTSRLLEFCETITLQEDKYNIARDAFIAKWMLGTIEAISNPHGADAPGILVLQGNQDIGKTWWTRKLVPEAVLPNAVRVGASIDPNNKDSVEQVVCHWIVEFGELDGIFRRADIASLKNFLTRPRDKFRRSFAPRSSDYPRRTSFIASVNEKNYLVDDTGNRRFWTLACKKVDSYHTIDMQQVWAEIWHKRREGAPYTLNDAEKDLLREINDQHTAIDPLQEQLASDYNWNSEEKTGWRWMTATQIVNELGYQRPDSFLVRRCGNIVRKLSAEQPRRSNGRDLLHIPIRN